MLATRIYTPGAFVWRELFTRDVAASQRFYGELFNWTFEASALGEGFVYTHIKRGDKQVGGLLDIASLPGAHAHVPSHWAVYVSVDDVDEAARRVTAAGGRILGECRDIPKVGRMATARDPQGGHFNLYRDLAGDPGNAMPGIGEFCWENLSTPDLPQALAFYQAVIGWGTTAFGPDTHLFTRQIEGEPMGLASVGQAPPGAPASWGSCVSVESVEDSLAHAKTLGATVLVDTTRMPGTGAFAIFQDPCEAVTFLFESATH